MMKRFVIHFFFLVLVLAPLAQAATLVWDARPAAEAVTVYRVYAGRGKAAPALTAEVATASYAINAALSGKYKFYVRAVNATGEGPPSNQVTVKL